MNQLTQTRIYRLLKPFRKLFVLVLLLNTIIIALNISNTYLLQTIINTAFVSNAITPLLLGLAVVVFVGVLANYFYKLTVNKIGISFGKNLKEKVFSQLIEGKIEELDKFTHGSLLSKVNIELEQLVNFLTKNIADVLFQPFMFLGASSYMLIINWKLFLACYILSPVIFLAINVLSKEGAKYSKAYYDNLSDANGLILDSIHNIEIVKSYNMQEDFLKTYDKNFNNIFQYVFRSERFDAFSLPFYFLISESPKIICLMFGGYLALQGKMSLGSLVAFLQLLAYVNAPLMRIFQIVANVRKFIVQVKSVDEILNISIEPISDEKLEATDIANLTLNNVSFDYGNKDVILRNFSIQINQGEKIALVGSSGSGKSTLFSLLCRFYNVSEGEYLLNDMNCEEISINDVRKMITYVSQTPYFLHTTIRENLAFGRENVTDEEMQQAIKLAGLEEYMEKLLNGYETIIEEQGRNLSGGEQLRMSIARAFIRPANIIILDEPTASLDTQNEEKLLQNILQCFSEKTVLLSSHRISTVEKMNRVICLQEGSIVEEGSVEELMTKKGMFYQFAHSNERGA